MYALSAGRTESCLLDEKPIRLAVYRPHLAAAEDNPIISFCGPMSVEGGNAMKKMAALFTESISACGGSRKRHSTIPPQCDPRGAFFIV